MADEHELLRAARAGDDAAGAALVALHGRSMIRTAWNVMGRYRGTDAEDVVQEAFIAALTTPAVPHGDVGAWLRAVTARKALDWLRQSGRRAEQELETEAVEATLGAADPARGVTTLAVRAALAELPALDRAVLTLVDLEGFSMAEAARAVGSTTMAVKWRAVRARRRLRALLERRGVREDELRD